MSPRTAAGTPRPGFVLEVERSTPPILLGRRVDHLAMRALTIGSVLKDWSTVA